jgi:hypothetical protein
MAVIKPPVYKRECTVLPLSCLAQGHPTTFFYSYLLGVLLRSISLMSGSVATGTCHTVLDASPVWCTRRHSSFSTVPYLGKIQCGCIIVVSHDGENPVSVAPCGREKGLGRSHDLGYVRLFPLSVPPLYSFSCNLQERAFLTSSRGPGAVTSWEGVWQKCIIYHTVVIWVGVLKLDGSGLPEVRLLYM